MSEEKPHRTRAEHARALTASGVNRRKKGTKGASTTGGVGPRQLDQANWRRKIQEGQINRLKFDDARKEGFLQEFAKHGRLMQAAQSVDISLRTVNDHLERDPEFAEAYEEARQTYRDRVHKAVELTAIEGVEKPIFGGQFKDEQVGTERVFYPGILLAEMKRVDPGYKDKQEIDLNHRGGVLVAPSQLSPTEWAEKFGKPKADEDAQKD